MKNKWVVMVISAVAFVAIWNLIDYLGSTFLTGDGYQFKVIGGVVVPIIVSVIVDLLFFRSSKGE